MTILAKDKKIICLVGIMGAGKSTIGIRLAKKLHIKFCDSDKEIEKKCHKSINEIFAQEGEKYFRQIEEEVILDIVEQNQTCVLSLGGGAFVNKIIQKTLKEHAISIWLDASLETILDRIGNKKNRPLLNNLNDIDKKEALSKLMNERKPNYEKCDIRVNSHSKNHDEMVQNIIKELQKLVN